MRAAILIVSVILLVFFLTHSHWNTPLRARDPSATVVVEVKGDVSKPGIYLLDAPTATIAAAAATAGCPWEIPPDVASRKLIPGQSVEVLGQREKTTIRMGPMRGGALLACGLKLDLNSASIEELLLVPRMRQEIAASIVERRKEKRWESVDELAEISGVGSKTVQNLNHYVEVSYNNDK